MKKGEMIHSDISAVIAKLGHTDEVTIADSGLPIKDDNKRIDLAYKLGSPQFIDVLETILTVQFVEEVTLAKEIKMNNDKVWQLVKRLIKKTEEAQGNKIKINFVTHDAFKKQTHQSKAVIRTGEITPYANIILKSGVVF